MVFKVGTSWQVVLSVSVPSSSADNCSLISIAPRPARNLGRIKCGDSNDDQIAAFRDVVVDRQDS